MRPGTSRPHGTCHHKIYGMGCDEFDRLLARAQGKCEVCGKVAEDGSIRRILTIDHDHRYGPEAVRGLVCDQCNGHLGEVDRGRRTLFDPPRTYEYFLNAWFVQRSLEYISNPDGRQRPHPDMDSACGRCARPRRDHSGAARLGPCPGTSGVGAPRFRYTRDAVYKIGRRPGGTP
jgi:Recombination endonuclease VII